MAEKTSLAINSEEGVNNKRKAIVDAAREIFSRQGYETTTIAEIASTAGIAVGTVYLYFRNKREIYLDTSQSWVMEIASALIKPELLQLPIEQVPQAMIEKAFGLCRQNNQFMSLIQIDTQSQEEQEVKRRGKEMVTQAMTTFFAQCIARGDFSPFDTKMYAKIIFGLVDSMLYDCFCLNAGANEELYRERTIEAIKRILFGPSLRG
ncbi:MAG TPA: TetR/AcrR family transcriptional regulator [Ktedonobacteraceae bacterium]